MSVNLVKVTQVMEGVHVLDELGKDNIWLIEGEDKCLLIDTGFGFLNLHNEISALTEKPVIVANSHIHPDHSSGNNQFDRVLCGRYDEPFAHEPVTENGRKEILTNFFPDPSAFGITAENWNPGPCRKVTALKDGDVISLGGNDIEVYEIPGHTIGSLAYLDRKHRLLFSGDTILTWQVWGQLSNSAALSIYYDSLKKIISIEPYFDFLAPGHTAPGKPYLMKKEFADIFAEGTEKILSGKLTGHDEKTFLGDGLCVLFKIGGMVYDPNRL